MEELIKLFENSFEGLRNTKTSRIKDVQDHTTMEEVLYKALVALEAALGKTRPEKGRWKGTKPLATVCCLLGKFILMGKEEDVTERVKELNRFKVGFHFFRVLSEEAKPT